MASDASDSDEPSSAEPAEAVLKASAVWALEWAPVAEAVVLVRASMPAALAAAALPATSATLDAVPLAAAPELLAEPPLAATAAVVAAPSVVLLPAGLSVGTMPPSSFLLPDAAAARHKQEREH